MIIDNDVISYILVRQGTDPYPQYKAQRSKPKQFECLRLRTIITTQSLKLVTSEKCD